MDSIVYWIGIAVRILLVVFLLRLVVWAVFWLVERLWGVSFSASGWRLGGIESLTIKNQNYEVQVNNVFLTLRWMDPTCRHFFKVNMGGVHVEYILHPGGDARKDAVKPPERKTKPSRKLRFLYWWVRRIAKLLEFHVRCLEICISDVVSAEVSFFTELQVSGHVNIVAQPLPDKVLAVSLEIEKAVGQFSLQSETPCPRTDDGLFPLAEFSFSSKVFVYLNPLRTDVGGVVEFLQINTVPLSLTLMQDGAVGYAIQHLKSFLPKTKGKSTSTETVWNSISKLPRKSEIVLEDVTLGYHANRANRVVSSKLTRVSMVTTLSPDKRKEGALPQYSIKIGLQDLGIMTRSQRFMKLHQLRLHSEHSSQTISNNIQIESVHASIWDSEATFWTQYLLETMGNKAGVPRTNKKWDIPSKQRISEFLASAVTLPVSMVTTIEASDWSILLRMDTPTLQSKEPVCRAVMASSVVNVQWSPVHEGSTIVRASLRLEDTYLHVPGFHPTSDSPANFRPRIDNPAILPSLRKHLWGRAVSLGSLILKAEKNIQVGEGVVELKLGTEPLRVTGEVCSLMVEWSKPTMVTATRVVDHLKEEYKLFSGGCSAVKARGDGSSVVPVEVKLQITDVNAFIYGLTPDPPALMVRLDAVSLSATPTATTPIIQLNLHGLLVENLSPVFPEQGFLCSSIANLPEGVGVTIVNSLGVKYDHQIKDLSWNVAKFTVNWSTTAHRSLLHVSKRLTEDIKQLRSVLVTRSQPPKGAPSSSEKGVVSLGEEMASFLDRVPLSVTVNLDTAECVAQLDRNHKLSLSLQTAHFIIKESHLFADVYEVGVDADKHRVFAMEGLVVKFPHTSEETSLDEDRKKFETMEVAENPTLGLAANKVEIVFPYKYHFGITLDRALSVKRFLQDLHKGSDGMPLPLLLPPDVLADCEEIIFQLCDDPFEVKLRANYELLCDEWEQKQRRLEELERKLEEFRKKQGEILSGKKVQSLYDSLEAKDSEVYCQRARKMYGSSEPQMAGLFVYSMQRTQLHAMFDPSMLREESLTGHLKDIDSISPPPEGKFSTLWGVYLIGETQEFQMQVRDYPQPLMLGTEVSISGRMLFAEQEAQEREKRSVVVEVGRPWGNATIQRKLPPLKYYYDFETSADSIEWSYGACLEPALAQTNLAIDLLTTPTVDTSKPLPYWDKLRLLFHGRIHLDVKLMTVILLGTANPYNNVEFLQLSLGGLDAKLLTNTQLDLEGSLQLLVHTASKYDECELLNFPHVKSNLHLMWDCGGKDPNNHYAVVRCAPDKIPIQPDKQEHDSYSVFRSQRLNLKWTLDVQPYKPEEHSNPPSILLYSSTLRWLEQYGVFVARNVTRPIRRGKYFKNTKSKRSPFTRHWNDVSVLASLPKSVLYYWSSVTGQQGLECNVDKGNFSIDYKISVHPVEEKNSMGEEMVRRARANWAICSCCGKVNDLTVRVHRKALQREEIDEFTCSESQQQVPPDAEEEGESKDTQRILLSMAELSYTRQGSPNSGTPKAKEEAFTHMLKTLNSRMLWNASNKEVVFGLFDAFKRARRLKRDLSAEALKSIASKLETPSKEDATEVAASEDDRGGENGEESSPRPWLQRHSSSGCTMLDQLLLDRGNKVVAHEEERGPSDPMLSGILAGDWKDVTQKNWFIELVNTQIALEGIEHRGVAVASSYVTQVFGCEHEPRLREGDLVTKNSWIAKVQDLQYFSTVGPSLEPNHVPWLPLSVICSPALGDDDSSSGEVTPRDQESYLNALLSELGPEERNEREKRGATPPGEAVGGLVSCLLIPGDTDTGGEEIRAGESKETVQLQRIASRCHCQIFYVTYGGIVETAVHKSPPILSPNGQGSSGLYDSTNEAVDTFTFRYPTVEVCTTSSQYALIMDIINNLLLHKELKRKEAVVRHARMQFMLQLSNIQDMRGPLLTQQNKVRNCLQSIRTLETQLFIKQRNAGDSIGTERNLEVQLAAAKEKLSTASMKLRAMIRAFKESQLYMTPPRGGTYTEAPEPVRRIEIWLDDAHWWLTQEDGQLQVADICLTNFSYNRVSYNDDSGEHRLELGTFKVRNLMPNTPSIYQQVLTPYDPKSRHLRVDKNICLRVYCRDKAPVAGIPVTEHMEVNVVPLGVSLTARFYQTMQDFFFPKAEGESQEQLEPDHSQIFGPAGAQPTVTGNDMTDGNIPSLSRGSSMRRSTMSISSVTTTTSTATGGSPPSSPGQREIGQVRKGKHHPGMQVDDVERMRERASHVKTFIYVKIPQITLSITYKSENVSYKDLQNVLVTVPTLEYHNRNWTWTDMLMEVKKDYKNAIIHQTLKNAIGIKESAEAAGLASPKLSRHASDLLLMTRAKASKSLAGKGKKLFGKLSSSREDISEEKGGERRRSVDTVHYQPPLTDSDNNLKRTYRKLSQLSQDAQK